MLLRRDFRPRASAVLLSLTIPGMILAMSVTSMGSVALPVMFAFGLAGRRIARQRVSAPLEFTDAESHASPAAG